MNEVELDIGRARFLAQGPAVSFPQRRKRPSSCCRITWQASCAF